MEGREISSDTIFTKKETEDEKFRRENQGRSKKQIEGNNKIGFYSIVGLIVVFIGILIYNYFK